MAYRKSVNSDDAYRKEERWNCDRCHTDKVIVKEIPIPTEKTMLVKLLMSLSEKYELEGTTVSVDHREVRAVFRFPEHDLRKLREIAENWADRGYINAKHPLKKRLAWQTWLRYRHVGLHPNVKQDEKRCGESSRNDRQDKAAWNPWPMQLS
jgi:hypothetical protein